MLTLLPLFVLALTVLGFFLGVGRVRALTRGPQGTAAVRAHSTGPYYGVYVALWTFLPTALLIVVWLALQPVVVERLLLAGLPASLLDGREGGEIDLLLNEIRNVAAGLLFGEPSPAVQAAAERLQSLRRAASLGLVVASLLLSGIGLALALRRLSPQFRARNHVERASHWILIACSTLAILTTLGIILSLLVESLGFFERVAPLDFLFGLNWEPQMPIREDQVAASGAFGAVPVFVGTLLVSAIAIFVAGPIGLLSAIYMAEYASPRQRATLKPVIEILAGVPTVVYGFFAVLTVAPALKRVGDALGLDVAANSALAAGSVMGIMIIPFISSLADDAIAAVPRTLRDGSYALGATQSETIRKVLLPAALPGIVSGFLLAVSRAIGETMIVVMAAGLIANMTLNPLEGVTTVTVQIVTLLVGDTAFDSPKTLSAFALGLVLFVTTLGLNVIALRVTKKYREKYD